MAKSQKIKDINNRVSQKIARIKLTNLILKLPEKAIDSLYEIICPMFTEYSVPEKSCCPHCGRNSVVRTIIICSISICSMRG